MNDMPEMPVEMADMGAMNAIDASKDADMKALMDEISKMA